MKILPSIHIEEALKLGLASVGENCRIADSVLFIPERRGSKVVIGDRVQIDHNTIIKGGTVIETGARISSNVRIEEDCYIGKSTFIGHSCVLRPKTRICEYVVIGHLTVFEGDSHIGSNTLIHAQCHITKGVFIGKKVFIAPLFCGANDPLMCHARRDCLPYEEKGYCIEDGARIAIGVSLLPDIHLGKNCLVGAHSLVTKDVPENCMVRGVPAKSYGEVPEGERV